MGEFNELKNKILQEQKEKERIKQIQQQRQERQQQQQFIQNNNNKSNSQPVAPSSSASQQFKHKGKFGMNFDPKNECVVIYISDEITQKNWGITLKKEDFNGPIRQEYRKLGGTVSSGSIKYTYPENGGSLGVFIEGENGEEYNYQCPQQY